MFRADFPMLHTQVHGKDVIYLDSAATSLQPQCVIDTLSDFFATSYGPVHRAIYTTANMATDRYEAAREIVRNYINGASTKEIIFTRGTTDGLNIIADSIAKSLLTQDSIIVVTTMEHHSNLVPWQMASVYSGAQLCTIAVSDDGTLDLQALQQVLETKKVAVMAVAHGSNVLGTINPIAQIADMVHKAGGIVVVDGAQTISHAAIDVQAMGCDVFCFSGHKMYGPTGVGVMWGKESLLERLSPTRGGGDMIDYVGEFSSTWNVLPLKFEPGTPMTGEVVALGRAIQYISSIGIDTIAAHEQACMQYLQEQLALIPRVQCIGSALHRVPLQSFAIQGAHALDIATLLDMDGIAVRSGQMCAQPLLRRFGKTALLRISLAMHSTYEEIDACIYAITQAIRKIL